MNCSEFEACLLEQVAAESHAGLVPVESRSHASICSRCAARLAEERALVAGLRAWANRTQHETAPAHVEAALLTRFRELERVKAAVPGIQSPKQALWKAPRYVGLAASVLLLLGWALIQFTRETGVEQAQHQPGAKPSASSEEKAAAALGEIPSPGVAAGADGVGPQSDTTHREGLVALPPPERGIPRKKTPEPSTEPVRKPVRPAKVRPQRVSTPVTEEPVHYAAQHSGRSEQRFREAERAGYERVETEFIPFMAAGPEFPSEQRQFVRVKLPRSALQVFGLPMNMERAREPVQADVMLGEDGRALAVRFVRD
jgi:hypothetical protein